MFFEAEMAFNELTSTALQLYDEWIKDAGKMINKTLNSVPEAKYLNKYEKYCCFIGKQIIKKYILIIRHMMIFYYLCNVTTDGTCHIKHVLSYTLQILSTTHSFLLFCQ